jgi:transposase-like protein
MFFLAFALATAPVNHEAEALAAIAIAKAKRDRTHNAAVEVAAPTFQSGGINKSHQCPSCEQYQWVISGFNSDGTHTHVCSRCSTQWRH